MTETPIEREIRLSYQREEELRREKGLQTTGIVGSPTTPTVKNAWAGPRPGGIANDTRDVQHRLATSRIQLEIQEATQREKELLAAGKIQTISEDTVDSKVTRFTELAEFAIAERERKLQLNSAIETKVSPLTDTTLTTKSYLIQSTKTTANFTDSRPIVKTASPVKYSTPQVRRFEPAPAQKGLMQRFLKSKGRMGSLSSFTSQSSNGPVARRVSAPSFSAPASVASTPSPTTAVQRSANRHDAQAQVSQVDGRLEPTPKAAPVRRGYMSAEEKIHEELMEMKKREDELRMQRAHLFAQSQPNLLSLMDEEEDSLYNKTEKSTLPLRSTLSNPNLLDSDDSSSVNSGSFHEQTASSKGGGRKRNALIAQWENMIQQYNEQ